VHTIFPRRPVSSLCYKYVYEGWSESNAPMKVSHLVVCYWSGVCRGKYSGSCFI